MMRFDLPRLMSGMYLLPLKEEWNVAISSLHQTTNQAPYLMKRRNMALTVKKEEEYFDDSNLPEKSRHPLDISCKPFPLHVWLYFLYIVLAIVRAILLPIFGTLLIICL